jgi:hypothetical protein
MVMANQVVQAVVVLVVTKVIYLDIRAVLEFPAKVTQVVAAEALLQKLRANRVAAVVVALADLVVEAILLVAQAMVAMVALDMLLLFLALLLTILVVAVVVMVVAAEQAVLAVLAAVVMAGIVQHLVELIRVVAVVAEHSTAEFRKLVDLVFVSLVTELHPKK